MLSPEFGKELWNSKAAFWDSMHGQNGNDFHMDFVEPTVDRLLCLEKGERVLDLCCGSGILSRHLVAMGADVTAVDWSEGLLERARSRGGGVDYQCIDATDENTLLGLGEGNFDAITSTMALMDVSNIEPMFRAAKKLLKNGGRMIVVTMHPAFFSNSPCLGVERGEREGRQTYEHYIKLKKYLGMSPCLGVGSSTEPNPHIYYHRPLHALLSPALDSGMMLDKLEELGYPQRKWNDGDPIPKDLYIARWTNLYEIPLVLAFRLRV